MDYLKFKVSGFEVSSIIPYKLLFFEPRSGGRGTQRCTGEFSVHFYPDMVVSKYANNLGLIRQFFLILGYEQMAVNGFPI